MTTTRHGTAVHEYPSELEILTTRQFDAPLALVFDVLTRPEHVRHWFAPFECEVTECSIDLRVGGGYRYTMRTADGVEHTMTGVYREIVAPERIVFVISFSDAEGGITRAPFPQLKNLWPLEVLNVVTFSEQGGKTTIALRGGPINATEEKRAMFAANTDSMRQGFGGTFEKLADLLAKS